MSKKTETKNKERVVLYIYYDEYEIDFACEKEKMLRKFCKDKNYDVVGVFRSPYYSDLDGLSPDIKLVLEDARNDKFDRFICYSLSEISENAEIQTVIAKIIGFCGVPVETIIEGNMDDDFFFAIALFENYNHKEELEPIKNPYIVKAISDLDAYQKEETSNKAKDLPF
ncbi:MAG: hypothetical protein ACI4VL_06475 [Bacilli bacterium]